MSTYYERNKIKILEKVKKYQSTEEYKEKRKLYKNNSDKFKKTTKIYRFNYRFKKYGITLSDYNKIFSNQNKSCAICGINNKSKEIKFVIDHDHKTNKVRGILCYNCNLAIGLFNDNAILLDKAIRYLTFPTYLK